MMAYVYFKESKMVICKINNVTSVDVNGKQINGDSTIIFGDSQDFIILQNDSTNLNIGDNINLDILTDERIYFTKGKDIWYQEKIANAISRVASLETDPTLPVRATTNEDNIAVGSDVISSLLTDILPSLKK